MILSPTGWVPYQRLPALDSALIFDTFVIVLRVVMLN